MPCVVAYERSCGPLLLHRKRGRASFRGAGQKTLSRDRSDITRLSHMTHLLAQIAIIAVETVVFCAPGIRKSQHISEAQNEKSTARTRSLRWMEMLWEATNITVQEEERKDEVLALLRGLVQDSSRKSASTCPGSRYGDRERPTAYLEGRKVTWLLVRKYGFTPLRRSIKQPTRKLEGEHEATCTRTCSSIGSYTHDWRRSGGAEP